MALAFDDGSSTDDYYVACQQRLSFGSGQDEFPLSKYVTVLESEVAPLNFDKFLQGEESGQPYHILNSAIEEYTEVLDEYLHNQALLVTLQSPEGAISEQCDSSPQELIPDTLGDLETLADLVSSVVDSYNHYRDTEKSLLSRLEAIKESPMMAKMNEMTQWYELMISLMIKLGATVQIASSTSAL